MQKYIANYDIKVYDIAYLEDDVIENFQSDFKLIARFFKNKRLGLNPLEDNKTVITHVEQFLEFLSVFAGDMSYVKVDEYIQEMKKKGSVITMCEIAQSLIAEGKQKGLAEGENKLSLLIKTLVSEGKNDDIIKVAEDKEYREQLYKQYNL